ncbi:uncharacterized protein MYCFIDRAFT_177599 [Pseudocercospora fijiensis CIRAD86]|uniref:Uncharacterized protein n=1 Tax=Pseudocercospora fijiensis (strain CIRAD86) TaxID=383855 RepID=M3AU50_PSEFD|nr:uncharacterized protein MYCFIDRAFT_177599 [Pseudocercospora fijiensis CIRAD86]EME80668.1 hypothetical protein MYCFIDRAFT_177599 [Pseudocercospora fijiensis CIRAD86]
MALRKASRALNSGITKQRKHLQLLIYVSLLRPYIFGSGQENFTSFEFTSASFSRDPCFPPRTHRIPFRLELVYKTSVVNITGLSLISIAITSLRKPQVLPPPSYPGSLRQARRRKTLQRLRQRERHASDIMRYEMNLDWPENVRIFQRLYNASATVKWVRDDYNNREKSERSQMWTRHIIKPVYTAQKEQDRATVRAEIINAAKALKIEIPITNPPVAAPPAPTIAPALQPLSIWNTQDSLVVLNTTVSTATPATTSATIPFHALPLAKRSAPKSRRLGPKFVLAGHPDPAEAQKTSEPLAKKPATAERVQMSRDLPSASS